MLNNVHLQISHGLKNIPICQYGVRSVNVFVFNVEQAFNLSHLPKDHENVLGLKLFSLEMKVLLIKLFVLVYVTEAGSGVVM